MFTKLTLINFILAALFLGFIDSDLRAEPRSNYADVEWFTTETDHFVIHYHQGVEWTARKVTSIADKVYDTVTEEYHYPLKDKVHVVVRDLEDHANGFAVWHLNWITIWATNSTFMLRGRHDWIYGTFVHEFAHIVSLHRSANWNGLIEGMRLGGVTGRSTESNSEFGGTLFLSANPVPRWWAEGAAQLDAADSGDDLFDSNQAMLLRTAVLENNLLNFDELHNIAVRENFSGELVYNQGFDFLRWLRDKFRLDKPEFSQLNLQLALQQAQHKHFDFEKNFQELFGKPARQLYKEWQTEITNNYSQQTAELRKQTVSGEKIRLIDDDDLAKIKDSKERAYKDGIWNFYPRYSPDGHFFSYVSSNLVNVRYLERPYDLTSMQGAGAGKIKTPQPTEVNSPSSWAAESNDAAHESSAALNFAVKGRSYAWSPDSTKMIVSRKVHDLTGGYQYYDLYLLDLSPLKRDKKSSPKVKRLTHQLRAIQPTWSPDGERVVFAKNQDGTIALYISDIEQLSTPHALIDHGAGAQALDPTWSPDGKRLAYTLFRDGDKHNSIWVYDFRTQQSAPLLQGNCEFRDPSWAADGNEIIFSSDLSGIFQIYKVSTQSQAAIAELTPLTNISSGGFYPYLRPDGKELLYSYFSSFGFKLYHLTPQLTPLKSLQLTNAPPSNDAEPVYPIIESSDYRTSFRPARFFPTFIFEDTQFKAGLSAQISDYLEKNNFFASAIFGRDQDYTLSYLNRSWIFDLLATFYNPDDECFVLFRECHAESVVYI
jgi:Tol biopolymer transport system component